MEHKNNISKIQEKVLNKIRMDELSMRPRLYFTAKVIAFVVVAAMVLLVSVFLFNFIVFAIHDSGRGSLLSFGWRGFELFLEEFPWLMLAVDVGLIFLLQWLLRQFSFGYKSPALILLGGLFAATLVVGLTIERVTPVNSFLLGLANNNHLPGPFNKLYEMAGQSPNQNTCRCTITAIGTSTIQADDIDPDKTTHLTVHVPLHDPNATTSGLIVGEEVFIAGDRDGNTMEAFGISKDNGGPRRHGSEGPDGGH